MEKVRPRCGQPSDRGRLKNRTEQTCSGRCELGCGGWPVHLAQVLGPHQTDAAVDGQPDDDRQVRDGAAHGDHDRLEHVAVGPR